MKKKKIPWDKLKTEDEVVAFFDQDISEYINDLNFDFKNSVKLSELMPKDKTVTLRMPEDLLGRLKKQAKKEGLGYQKFMRFILENYLNKVS